ncbi:rhodanese-like domain-containing protein [Emericellopsis atlantica]|uniref:M-phase inducer phosphatase n=1 Tax=Emericellopsis atlantica TaxID=2614577 RepID=A0A9P7ZUG1_9HYPO|nr:rhodanese-like domain-containing protein [Emericellopsis atlantica]KAG9257987.1 rhodanese-like domain-containing protein [Emericellopsis atlantica]
MEASSPLAAMQPTMAMPSWGAGPDMFRSHPRNPFANGGGVARRALRERLQKTDYFNVKEIPGSSPAASLAADLSQNFRIDTEVSPQFPTPRRALFTANMMGGVETRGFCTTPPLPSSSPAPTMDTMDSMETMEMSPLPHKPPFTTQIEITSPTPLATPSHDDDSMMLDSPPPLPRQSSVEPSKVSLTDRKIAALRRPSLTRAGKVHSTNSVPNRAVAENPLPSFRFGAGMSQSSTNLSLSECFDSASPPQERRPVSANSLCAPLALMRSRPQLNTGSPRLGSPAAICHGRRSSSNPYLRSRKQVRRSLSMFENPGDVTKPNLERDEPGPSGLQAVMDTDDVPEPVLPHFLSDDPADTIPRITKETLLEVLDGKYADNFDQKMVIDCRFEYEYEGGHIDGAVNYNDKELLASQLLRTPMAGRTLLVFHCEYSAHRAPMMARHVRSEDRTMNAEFYPRLNYPDVYLLDGGYSAFFAEHRGRCFPPEYVEMSDEKHQRTCEREMGRLKQRKGFGRAQTFAFGQRETCEMDSPTGPARPSSRHAPMSFGEDSPIFGERTHARRMASY